MGNLHRIRNAYNKLPEQEKARVFLHGSGCSAYKGHKICFAAGWSSYKRFIKSLGREYFSGVALRDIGIISAIGTIKQR